MHKRGVMFVAGLTFAACSFLGVAAFFTARSATTTVPKAASSSVGMAADPSADARDVEPETPISEQTRFAKALAASHSDEEKLRLLASYADAPWADATSPALLDCIKYDRSPRICDKAMDVGLALASRSDGSAQSAVLKAGLGSVHSAVRVRSLRECRARQNPELIDDLLSAAKTGGAERYMAVHALAQFDDVRAQQVVLNAARDESLPKVERARAIALLARSSHPDACEYLKKLASDPASEYASIALSALAAMQETPNAERRP